MLRDPAFFWRPNNTASRGRGEGRIGRLRSLEKMPPKYAIFSTVWSKIAGTVAWERLQKEYRHTKLVVNAHMDEIVNLTPVKENSFEKAREYYEGLTKNFTTPYKPWGRLTCWEDSWWQRSRNYHQLNLISLELTIIGRNGAWRN